MLEMRHAAFQVSNKIFLSLAMSRILILLLALCSQLTYAPALEAVQAQVPPRTSFAGAACKQTIFEHSFASSYGVLYVGKII
jgi:hypothetical protein